MTNKDMKCPLFVGYEALDLDSQSGDIKLLFRGQDDRRYHLRLAHLTALESMRRVVKHEANSYVG